MYQVSSAQHHMVLTYLQLLDSFPSFADDQTHFRCRDEKLLDCAVAIYVIVKAGSIPTAVHNLPQEPFGLSLGRRKITRDPALNGYLRSSGKGNGAGENAKESRQPSIQLQLLPHNLGGLNHSPCYRTVIQKQHTPHHTTTVSRWSLKNRALTDPSPYMSALCSCLRRHNAMPPTLNISRFGGRNLLFISLPISLFPNPA